MTKRRKIAKDVAEEYSNTDEGEGYIFNFNLLILTSFELASHFSSSEHGPHQSVQNPT